MHSRGDKAQHDLYWMIRAPLTPHLLAPPSPSPPRQVQQLRSEGDARAAATAAAARSAASQLEVLTHRLRCMVGISSGSGTLEVPQQELLSMPEHAFVSGLSSEEARRLAAAGPVVKVAGVASYPLRRLTPGEEARLRKAAFLRRVEQAEWAQRPPEERGQVVTVRAFKGRMAGRFSLAEVAADDDGDADGVGDGVGGGKQAAVGAQEEQDDDEDGVPSKSADGDNIEGNEVRKCGRGRGHAQP